MSTIRRSLFLKILRASGKVKMMQMREIYEKVMRFTPIVLLLLRLRLGYSRCSLGKERDCSRSSCHPLLQCLASTSIICCTYFTLVMTLNGH